MTIKVLVRGGGDLASGIVLRLIRSGLKVVVTELAQPLTIRRSVAFSEAVYEKSISVEGVEARLVQNSEEAVQLMAGDVIPVLIDPEASQNKAICPDVIVDARMLKTASSFLIHSDAPLVIGIGPGFECGRNCHAIVETKRGHYLGRALWDGSAEKDTGLPEAVLGQQNERVLRSPGDGIFNSELLIGNTVLQGEKLFSVGDRVVQAPFTGIIRGLIHNGLTVHLGLKVGDIDPRNDPQLVRYVSDKALAIGGGVLEAILSREALRARLEN